MHYAVTLSFTVPNFLVHCFFKHAETSYFTVERIWLESKLDLAYTNPNSITNSDVSTMCVIFGVLAFGTQHAYLESATERIGGRKSTQHGPFTGDTIGVMLYQQACLLLPDFITLSSLKSVQACLLLGIYTLPLDASGLAWIYLGIGVKLANQNGMHRKTCEDSFDLYIRETKNLVWWTLYTLGSSCVSAAHTVIEICRHLYNTIGLARASYTEFSACHAALLVINTQCLQATDYRQHHAIREGFTMLKEMSGEAELARTEVSLIEGFQHIIASMDIAGDDVAGDMASDFSTFKNWENSWRQDSFFAQNPRPDDSILMASLGLSSGSPGASSGELSLWTSLFGSDRDGPSCTQGQDDWTRL
ncbi:unnamed protein product [Aspergillus oryzae var. brunneus]|uniref:Unnamed protein product n=1 Tax=Aspergillus oryzae var. brunneus TaxID=332754 RepID=A0ABQ6KWS3_ASPOZ|nr:unnamed protein product [Aspergillus oryzae]GMG48471.1 unnamed protein product [Aspergillus oryzae var. brunneus]